MGSVGWSLVWMPNPGACAAIAVAAPEAGAQWPLAEMPWDPSQGLGPYRPLLVS